jgi:hypothetical protein
MDLSPEEFAEARDALAFAQALEFAEQVHGAGRPLGLAPLPGTPMTRSELAEWYSTTPEDIYMIERVALAKLADHPLAYELLQAIIHKSDF